MSVDKMKIWLQEHKVPKELTIGRHYQNADTGRTMETALATLAHSEPWSLNYRAAYWRLLTIKRHLEQLSTK
jgi:hypothetical protein